MSNLLAWAVEVGHLCDFSARLRYAQQHCPTPTTTKENPPSAAPRAAEIEPQDLAERLNRPAGALDLFQLAIGEKADEAAVGRPEGEDRALCSGERPGLGGIERAHPELHIAAGGRGESQETAIGRQSDLAKARPLRRQDGSLKDPRV